MLPLVGEGIPITTHGSYLFVDGLWFTHILKQTFLFYSSFWKSLLILFIEKNFLHDIS